jgi:hypothetical protein
VLLYPLLAPSEQDGVGKKIRFVCTANICRHCIRLPDVM